MSSLPLLSRGTEAVAPEASAVLPAGSSDLAVDEVDRDRVRARRAEASELPTLAEQAAQRRLRRGLAGDMRSAVRGVA